jgi:polysaccharide deacetylase family protein (PEP-CTERM system associated)
MLNALTIDVEDWFCVEAFSKQFPIETWDKQKTRILSNIVRTLEILDDYDVKATFFVLGWIADKFPEIVDYLYNHGHEIGSHSYSHKLVFNMSPDQFREDTLQSLEAINKACDVPVLGYRAPSFSIKPEHEWVWEILADCGFKYDSSVFPVTHDIYGSPDAPRFANIIQINDDRKILEIPPSTVRLFGRNFGFGGGGYLRLFPYWFTEWGIKKVNHMGFPAIVYFHPWEIDFHQPRQKVGTKSMVRHYTNLRTTEIKLRKLLKKFTFAPVREVFNLSVDGQGKKET